MAALSVGTFLWPPLMRFFMDIFGWRGALFLVAGIELHGIALSMLLRPLPAWAIVKTPLGEDVFVCAVNEYGCTILHKVGNENNTLLQSAKLANGPMPEASRFDLWSVAFTCPLTQLASVYLTKKSENKL